MRIVFAGTPEFAVPSLVAAARRNEVVAVYTQPDRPAGRGRALTPSPVKRAALERGIEVFQPESLKSQVSRDALAALRPGVSFKGNIHPITPPVPGDGRRENRSSDSPFPIPYSRPFRILSYFFSARSRLSGER